MSFILFTAGSFALNQAQEWKLDSQMDRTKFRPIPQGKIKPQTAFIIAGLLLIMGSIGLLFTSEFAFWLSLGTLIFYNGFYTLYWKKRMAFGAIPGALPGAMPVVIGYAAINSDIFTLEALYVFLIMFLWQMPHFWSLAIRYQKDYAQGDIPVLPRIFGIDKTLFHMGFYVLSYVTLAMTSPWFVETGILYLLLVIPFSLKVVWEFYCYSKHRAEKNWLPFFLWVNLSMLIYLCVPLIEKWTPYIWGVYYYG